MTPDIFGCEGLETFAAADEDMVFSGLSVGGNAHGLMATVNHVKITDPNHQNYDRLTELVLTKATTIDEAVDCIQAALSQDSYWWGNLIIADPSGSIAIEIRGHDCQITPLADRVFRANHQPLFGEASSPDDLPCSARRAKATTQRLPHIRSIQDLKNMLSAHDDGTTGICNHGVPLSTVYSYILVLRDGEMTLHIANGRPCEAEWMALTPPLGARWSQDQSMQFLNAYPGLDLSSH